MSTVAGSAARRLVVKAILKPTRRDCGPTRCQFHCFKRTSSQVVMTGTGHHSNSHLPDLWLSEGVELSEEESNLAGE